MFGLTNEEKDRKVARKFLSSALGLFNVLSDKEKADLVSIYLGRFKDGYEWMKKYLLSYQNTPLMYFGMDTRAEEILSRRKNYIEPFSRIILKSLDDARRELQSFFIVDVPTFHRISPSDFENVVDNFGRAVGFFFSVIEYGAANSKLKLDNKNFSALLSAFVRVTGMLNSREIDRKPIQRRILIIANKAGLSPKQKELLVKIAKSLT